MLSQVRAGRVDVTEKRDDSTRYTRRLVEDEGTLKRGSEAVSTKQVKVDSEPPPPPPPPPSGEE